MWDLTSPTSVRHVGLTSSAKPSDVLRRHVENHPQYATAKNQLIACIPCRNKRRKCDEGTPCGSCVHASNHCVRAVGGQPSITVREAGIETSDGTITVGHDSVEVSDNSDVPTSALQTPDGDGGALESPNGEIASQALSDSSRATRVSAAETAAGWPPLQTQNAINATVDIDPFLFTVSPSQDIEVPASRTHLYVLDSATAPTSIPSFSATPRSQSCLEQLQLFLERNSALTQRLLQVYFDQVHPYWPILHTSTFSPEDTSPLLLGAMLMLADYTEDGPTHGPLAVAIFEAMISVHLVVHP